MFFDESLLRDDLTEVELLKYNLLQKNVLSFLNIYIKTPLMMGNYDERVAGLHHMGHLVESLLGAEVFVYKPYFEKYVLDGWSNNFHRGTPKGEELLSNAVDALKNVCVNYIKANFIK